MSSRSSSSSSSSSDNESKRGSSSERSRSRSRSGSRSPSGKSSRASSRSTSPGSAKSGSKRSSSASSSPKYVSDGSSDASKKSDSSGSSKGKRKLKAKDRKVSNKLSEKMKDDSDDEEVHSSDDERTKKPSAPSRGRRAKQDESEEEGEIGSDEKEFDDGLDEDLIGDDEDRARLQEMTEREREEELFKRAENRENLRKRFEIQKKLKQQQKLKKEENRQVSSEEEGRRSDSESEKSKKGSDDSDEDNYRSASYGTVQDAKERSQDRRKNLDALKYDKKSSALSELKAKRQERERKDLERAQKQREEKSKGEAESDSDSDKFAKSKKDSKKRSRSRSSSSSSGRARKRSSSSSSSSSSRSGRSRRSSSGSASDTERFHKSPSKQTQKYIETQEDLEPIRLSRFKLERFIHLPFFKKLVIGCFVRIGIGQHEGRSVYRAAEVVDVIETAKIYSLGKIRTNLGLKLRFGKQERVFRLEFISNSGVTPQEFEKWRIACFESSVTLPTLEFVRNKSAEIKKALSYEYTSEDVDKIVAQKEKFHKHPVNYAMHKARLMKERDAALTIGDEARAREFDQKLNELEERAEELDKKRTSTISSVSLINDRNRKANVSKAEVAIMEEIRMKKIHGKESNPFVRRQCKPRMVTKTKDAPVSEEVLLNLASADQKENKLEEPVVDVKRRAESPPKDSSAKKLKHETSSGKEDLFDAHNFDIDINVDTSIAGPAASNKPVISTTLSSGKDLASVPTKRSLNLDDYKKKRGLI